MNDKLLIERWHKLAGINEAASGADKGTRGVNPFLLSDFEGDPTRAKAEGLRLSLGIITKPGESSAASPKNTTNGIAKGSEGCIAVACNEKYPKLRQQDFATNVSAVQAFVAKSCCLNLGYFSLHATKSILN